jgi:RNA-binding protein
MELKGRHLRHLRGLAHDLVPVVLVGKAGVTEAIGGAVGEALLSHELIKVKLPQADKVARAQMAAELAAATSSALVALTGRVVVLYRPHPEQPVIELPA